MKCDNCFAHIDSSGCKAGIREEDIKIFSDGKCGCKYKSNTVKELVKLNEIVIPEDTSDTLVDEDVDVEQPVTNKTRECFKENERVKSLYSDTVYTVKSQSDDKLVVFVESKLAGTQVIAASDLVRVK